MSCGTRLIGSTLLAIPVVAVSMVMGWQFAGWQWLALALTTPVVAWGGYPFHRAALLGLRHRTTTMDTLVSLGTLAAYLWSTAAVLRRCRARCTSKSRPRSRCSSWPVTTPRRARSARRERRCARC